MNIDEILHLYSEEAALETRTLDYWSSTLMQTSILLGSLTFTVKDSSVQFTQHDILPAYLGRSVQELHRKSVLVSESQLSTATDSSVDFLTKAFGTLMSRILTPANSNTINDTKFVHIQILDELREAISTTLSPLKLQDTVFALAGNDFNVKTFLQTAVEIERFQKYSTLIANLSEKDLQFLLSYLATKKMAIRQDGYVYFASSVQAFTQANGKIPESCLSIFKIRQTIVNIGKQITTNEVKVVDYTTKAKALKTRGDSNGAMLQLKLRKNVDCLIQRLQHAQFSLEESLQTIEGTEANQIIINAYHAATNALRITRFESGVTVDSIESAVDLFQSEMEEMQEIGSALTAATSIGSEESAELEAELIELIKASEDIPKTSVIPELEETLPSPPIHPVQQLPGQSEAVQVDEAGEDKGKAIALV